MKTSTEAAPAKIKKTRAPTIARERAAPPVHEARAYETWDEKDIHSEEAKPWVRPSSLEAPDPRPGFAQRWIRVGSMGKDDPTNTARKFREGWRPRPASTLPVNYHAPTISNGKWAGTIGVEGMVLCEMPLKMRDKRNAHYSSKTKHVTAAIETELQNQSRPGMPITQERTSKVVRNVKIAEDSE
jgi:hypothetical protein